MDNVDNSEPSVFCLRADGRRVLDTARSVVCDVGEEPDLHLRWGGRFSSAGRSLELEGLEAMLNVPLASVWIPSLGIVPFLLFCFLRDAFPALPRPGKKSSALIASGYGM